MLFKHLEASESQVAVPTIPVFLKLTSRLTGTRSLPGQNLDRVIGITGVF